MSKREKPVQRFYMVNKETSRILDAIKIQFGINKSSVVNQAVKLYADTNFKSISKGETK